MQTEAGDRWRAMVEAEHHQSERVRDAGWRPSADPYASHVASFRADPARNDDPVLNALLDLISPDDTVVDLGAGAGRYALPLARRVREVLAVEPSPAMTTALAADAEQAGIPNIRPVPATWEEAPPAAGDLAFAAHMGYTSRRIEDLLAFLSRAARRWAAMIVFAEPPQHRLFPFWLLVHGEERLPLPHLPQLLAVLEDLGARPEVEVVADALFPLGQWDQARQKLRRRLFLTPGSLADARLGDAMARLLSDWGGGVFGPKDRRPLGIAMVRWHPGKARP